MRFFFSFLKKKYTCFLATSNHCFSSGVLVWMCVWERRVEWIMTIICLGFFFFFIYVNIKSIGTVCGSNLLYLISDRWQVVTSSKRKKEDPRQSRKILKPSDRRQDRFLDTRISETIEDRCGNNCEARNKSLAMKSSSCVNKNWIFTQQSG